MDERKAIAALAERSMVKVENRCNTFFRFEGNASMLIDGFPKQADLRACAFRISIMTGCLILAFPASAETLVCNNPKVEVSAQTSDLLKEVCTASELALEFLSRYGVRAKHPVRIRIVEQPLQNRSYSAYGSYDSRSDLVQVMSPRAIRESLPSPQLYNQPFDQEHYRGAIAHEVAHALIQQNSRVSPLPVGAAAQEYLACVTQLSVLPREKRDRVIRAFDIGPWEPGDVISNVYMAMAPERFAVKSYLHFQGHPLPAKFVDELLGSKWFYVNVE